MNMLYVHKNWKDEVSMQRALVGPFVECDDVPRVADPKLLTREELMDRIQELEETIAIMKDEKNAEVDSPKKSGRKKSGKVSTVDDSFLDDDVSDSLPAISLRSSKSSPSKLTRKHRAARRRLQLEVSSSSEGIDDGNDVAQDTDCDLVDTTTSDSDVVPVKRGRGRPKKNTKSNPRVTTKSSKRKVVSSTRRSKRTVKKRRILDK